MHVVRPLQTPMSLIIHSSTPFHHESEPGGNCSLPSYVYQDDDKYEQEIEEEELILEAPVGHTKPGMKKEQAAANTLSSRAPPCQAAPTGLVLSKGLPITRGREPVNYFTMEPSDYTELRKDVNRFLLHANATDP